MGEHPLHRFRVPFDELTQRELTLLDYFIKLIYGSHLLEITSIVGTSSFPKATTLLLPVAGALKPRTALACATGAGEQCN